MCVRIVLQRPSKRRINHIALTTVIQLPQTNRQNKLVATQSRRHKHQSLNEFGTSSDKSTVTAQCKVPAAGDSNLLPEPVAFSLTKLLSR